VGGLYMLMGRGLERVAEARAGNIVGIGGLAQVMLPRCRPSSMSSHAPAMLLFE
jgi:translation elongation factor EF-G